MDTFGQRITNLKKELIALKNSSASSGDSASMYYQFYNLGEYPRDNFDVYYLWHFYFEPLKNNDDFCLMPTAFGQYGYYTDYWGTREVELELSRAWEAIDIENPNHIMVALEYLTRSGYELKGSNILCVSSNTPFVLKESYKEVKYRQ